MQSTLLFYVTDYYHSTPLMHGDIKKSYRSVYWKELPGQGKESCMESLIEHHVVNCLCVGGEKSICFLTAVTSGPWGEKLEQTDRHTHTLSQIHTHTSSFAKTPQTMPCKSNLTHRGPLFLYWHTHSIQGEQGRARGVIEPRPSQIHLLIAFLLREESGT